MNNSDQPILPQGESWPKISIVTPSFNQAEFIERTICSVLNQNYPNLEYIIMDGGSTDGTLDIIKQYESKLFFWSSEKDGGMYDAIQKGFEKSSGTIMAWINSDDLYYPNAFFTVAEIFLQFPSVSWLQGCPTLWDEKDRTILVKPSRRWSKYDYYSYDYKWIQQESIFWRRSLWNQAGSHLNQHMKYAGDFELWLRFFNYAPLYITDALIGGFRTRSSNQLTHEHMDEYLNEIHSVLAREKLPFREKNKLQMIRMLKPMIRLFLKFRATAPWIYKNILECPPKVVYDFKSQTWQLKN
ncbi:MAG: glycosyltransferase, partial [Candidatus Aureabacteria bacterium]|nr:glycosyltransferase [Candidatus Auribacterota bacterium]